MFNSWEWNEGVFFTTFIVGARYVTVLHNSVGIETLVEEVLNLVGKDKLPFVILNSISVPGNYSTILDNDLAELVIGL